jgi:hypothetical protein
MLKGQLFEEMEISVGTIILISLVITFLLEVFAPMMTLSSAVSSSEGEVRATEFANFLKNVLPEYMGNEKGELTQEGLSSNTGKPLTAFGFSDNRVDIENLVTNQVWEFGTQRQTYRHDAYTTIHSHYMPVTGVESVIMKGGNDYVLHIYESGGNTILDIYSDYVCNPDVRKTESEGKYNLLACWEFSGLSKIEAGAERIRDEMIAPVVNMVGNDLIYLVSPKGDVKASELVIGTAGLDVTDYCLGSGEGSMCIRIIGRYSFPARIHAEIGKEGGFRTDVAPIEEITAAEESGGIEEV